MADFEAPSFSLGLDDDLLDSEPQISSVSEDDDYENLIVDDSEPDYSDPPGPPPKPKRLRRIHTVDVTTSSTIPASPKADLHSRAVVDDQDIDVFCLQEDMRTDEHLHTQNRPRRRSLLMVSDSDSDDPSVSAPVNNRKPNGSDSIDLSTTENSFDLDDSLPPAHRYFFHNDLRIQELVRSRLPNFSPLDDVSNRNFEQPSTSNIDYKGQFSSKQAARNIEDKKSSSSRKISRKEKVEEVSQGWVNPKLGVDKVITKGAAKRQVHSVRKTAGHWLTGPDGKKVYVGKKGLELTGRVAYMQYKKESGAGFKKAKWKSGTKKKK